MEHKVIREIIAVREKASVRLYCGTCDSAAVYLHFWRK
jgi:hypothetical protein